MGGYVVRITGGNDKQGFPMKQGVPTNQRVRLLLGKGQSCYRPRRDGERKRKSAPQGWQEAEIQGPQGPEAGDPSYSSEEETQARPQEEEGREEQAGCC